MTDTVTLLAALGLSGIGVVHLTAYLKTRSLRMRTIRRLLHRNMVVIRGDGKHLARCMCGYTAEIDWTNPMFAELHECQFRMR